MGMIPGIGKMVKNTEIDEDAFKPFEAMIGSMTPQERSKPDLLDRSRRARIAQGSGISLQQVNSHLKQFEDMRKMMQKMSKGGAKQMLKGMM